MQIILAAIIIVINMNESVESTGRAFDAMILLVNLG